ncbi:hypothetical protein DOZ91_23465 [Peribacillus frigoritolerans]|nr:hypothetical protein DOZ91_23465 [Peribacillus frigoritolerans]
MAAGKIQFYNEIMKTTIGMVSGITWEPLPRVSFASFKGEMSKGPVRSYILRRVQERACTWVLKWKREQAWIAAPFNFYRWLERISANFSSPC